MWGVGPNGVPAGGEQKSKTASVNLRVSQRDCKWVLGSKELEQIAQAMANFKANFNMRDIPLASVLQNSFELRPEFFDGIQVWAVQG